MDSPSFNKVVPSIGSFFVAPRPDVHYVTTGDPSPVFGAATRIVVTIFPRVNILGSTTQPPKAKINVVLYV